jgi:hypothetical protein
MESGSKVFLLCLRVASAKQGREDGKAKRKYKS